MKVDNHTLFETAVVPLQGLRGFQVTVIAKGTFGFDGLSCLNQMPIAYGDIMNEKDHVGDVMYESDIVPFKPATDIALAGKAWAPENKPAEAVLVTLHVGSLSRSLCVFGQRNWKSSRVIGRRYIMTEPMPFLNRPLTYRDAFGGVDGTTGEYCKENPIGTGFCFICRNWQPRADFAGTYDNDWRQNRWPLPPEDFDARFYNAAHPDLQVSDYLMGDEAVEMINLSNQGKIEFELPGLQTHCWIERRTKPAWELEESVTMHLDTLFLMPEERRFCLVWRGSADLREPSCAEIERITIGASKIKQEK